jgi:hypothetical protein
MDTAQLVLLLSEAPGIGDKSLGAILRRNAVLRRSPEEFLGLSVAALTEEYGLRPEAAKQIGKITPALRDAAAATAKSVRRSGIQMLTLLDAVYPERLLQRLDDPPPVLYAYGYLSLLKSKTFAVANSNGASEEALAAGDQATEAAIQAGWWPVTGHNRPAYQRPALVARRNGGRICFFLDRGLLEAFGGDLSRDLFPAARIWSPSYDPERDLTLSPFPLRAHSLAAHNRKRDALIFAIADVIFAGHVRPGGQMEQNCLNALAQDRLVYLLGEEAMWNESLVEAGAVAVPETLL